jgi:integrase
LGHRRSKQFATKKDADNFAATASVEVRQGVHVADSATVTVEVAGKFWLASVEAASLERSTVCQYRQHLSLHIVPFIGHLLLNKITVPAIRTFEDELRQAGRSTAMRRKVLASLSTLLADAQERGLVARNVARDRRNRRGAADSRDRRGSRLKMGIDIPLPSEIKSIVSAASGRWRPLLITAIFTGLRASELRGLRWIDVDLDTRTLSVRQRADAWGKIGPPKSVTSERTIPLPPIVVNTLREWRLVCPKRDSGRRDADGSVIEELHLVFPNGSGNPESHPNIIHRGLWPTLIAADVADTTEDENGKTIVVPRYRGLHALRHWYASWCLNRVEDGGLGLPPKTVQTRLGHSTLAMTMDTYGHLFPDSNDTALLAVGERALLA